MRDPAKATAAASVRRKIKRILGRYGAPPDDPDRADEYYMRAALELAALSAGTGESPVGCVIVRDGGIVSGACNVRETSKNALGHAEILAINEACSALGGWRLTRATLYVTLEPCPMCAGAVWAARVPRVVYGADSMKNGAYGSKLDMRSFGLNHAPEVKGGVLAPECSALLSDFFRKKRDGNDDIG